MSLLIPFILRPAFVNVESRLQVESEIEQCSEDFREAEENIEGGLSGRREKVSRFGVGDNSINRGNELHRGETER